MISIVMATYNGCRFIDEQLQSLVAQTVLPDEIIISDDGSTDCTLNKINNFIKNYHKGTPAIKFIVHRNSVNQGYIKNFMNAILMSKGDIVFLCDQDDIWKKDKVEVLSNYLINYHVKAIHSDIDLIDENKRLIKDKWENYHFKFKLNKRNMFLKKLNYCGMSLVFDGEFVRTCIKKTMHISIPTHDWAICAFSDISDSFAQIGNVYTLRRYHSNNVALQLSPSFSGGGVNERIVLLKKYYNYYCVYKELLLVLQPKYKSKQEIVEKMIRLTEKRILYLSQKKPGGAILLIRYLNNYPSVRAYCGDLLYIFNLKGLIRKFGR